MTKAATLAYRTATAIYYAIQSNEYSPADTAQLFTAHSILTSLYHLLDQEGVEATPGAKTQSAEAIQLLDARDPAAVPAVFALIATLNALLPDQARILVPFTSI